MPDGLFYVQMYDFIKKSRCVEKYENKKWKVFLKK